MSNSSPFNVNIPKELVFVGSSVKALKLQNTSDMTAVFKIKSNQKTALSISCSHDFIPPHSIKQIPVKLLEVPGSIKLQVNYAKATEQMLQKNDSKMNSIDKANISKAIVKIIAQYMTQSTKNQPELTKSVTLTRDQEMSSSLYNSITAGVQNTIQISKTSVIDIEKSKELQVVVQHQEEDSEDLEEKRNMLMKKMKKLDEKLVNKKEMLRSQQQQSMKKINQLSFVKPNILFLLILAAFFMGSLIRFILF